MTSGRGGTPSLRFLVVLLLVALDLWSKQAVFAFLESDPAGLEIDSHYHERFPVAGSWLGLMRSLNTGMAFGFLKAVPHLLVGGRCVAVLLLGWLLLRADSRRKLLLWALVLVLAGALGNLYDNLFLDDPDDAHPYGAVRDWIDVYFGVWDWHFPTFNVADSCISVGAVLLLASGFLPQREETEGADGAAQERETPADAAGAA